jgi:hypothetical protein
MKSFVTAFFVFASLAMFTQSEAQTLGSCHIFPSNNPWNTRVDTMKVDSVHSAAYIASVGGGINVHPDFGRDTDYGIPWEAVNGKQTFVSVNTSNGYQDQSDPGPMPIPPNAEIEHDDDSHVLVIDTSNHYLYEVYQGVKDQNDNNWSATSTAIFSLDSNNYRPDGWTSCDAAGLPIFPGLVRLDECKAGAINHALRFTVPSSQQAWIFPARHHAGAQTDTNHMPMGTRLRLKASYDDSQDTGYAKVIITALKKYGIILADNGSAWYISGEWNPNWPDDDIGQLKAISGNDFEVVNTGYPIETDSKEYPTPVIPIPSVPSGGGVLHVAMNPINFGQVHVGHADTMVLAISNSGNGPLIISKVAPLGQNLDFTLLSYALLLALPDTLQPGAMISTPVQYTPSGVVYDTLSFQLTISGTPGQTSDTTISLIGEGVPSLSVAATAQPEPFTFYPNPTSGILSISANSIEGPARIEITDQLGRTVLLQTVQSGSESLDLSGLPNGAYFARLIGSNGSASQRIILAR